MQRGGGGGANPVRTALIVCVLGIALLTVIYFMKRMEANRLSKELQVTRVDRKELEEDMNSQLSDHLAKIESLTQEISLLQTRLTTCEDEKGAVMKASDDAKHAAEACELKFQDLEGEKDELDQQLERVKADGSDAANAFEENKRELENLQTELITTRAERDRYQSQVTQMEQSMQQSATQLVLCQRQVAECSKPPLPVLNTGNPIPTQPILIKPTQPLIKPTLPILINTPRSILTDNARSIRVNSNSETNDIEEAPVDTGAGEIGGAELPSKSEDDLFGE